MAALAASVSSAGNSMICGSSTEIDGAFSPYTVSYFHLLASMSVCHLPDAMHRSCRVRLVVHNARRRKRDPSDPQAVGDALLSSPFQRKGPLITVDLPGIGQVGEPEAWEYETMVAYPNPVTNLITYVSLPYPQVVNHPLGGDQ